MNIGTNDPKGTVILWDVLPKVPAIDWMESLEQDESGLRIVLRPVDFIDRHLVIAFDVPLCFRSTEEGYFLNAVDPFEKKLWGKTFYIIGESSFLRQFHENSSWAYDDLTITHYGIFTSNYCLDILSANEPVVQWLEKSK